MLSGYVAGHALRLRWSLRWLWGSPGDRGHEGGIEIEQQPAMSRFSRARIGQRGEGPRELWQGPEIFFQQERMARRLGDELFVSGREYDLAVEGALPRGPHRGAGEGARRRGGPGTAGDRSSRTRR